jgi:hypothetical protein
MGLPTASGLPRASRAAPTDEGGGRARFLEASLIGYPSALEDASKRQERRYQFAHLAAHAAMVLGTGHLPRCQHAAGGTEEEDAVYLAGVLLVPGMMLRSEAETYVYNYDPQQPSHIGGLVAEVASGFVVPAWLAANRLVQEGLLSYAAGEETS